MATCRARWRVDEIRALVRAFAEAARRAVAAGFDAIEIHGAHGYLVGQFLSPFANRRDDDYGGDFERRLRFPLEVIAAVRAVVVGDRVPLLYRLSADEHVDGGLTLADACRIAARLEAAGIDLIDVSAGIYESAPWIVQPMEMAQGCLAPLAREIRRHVGIPVSVAGRISDASVAEHVLEAGDADFVTLGRALHADPEMPRKSAHGRRGRDLLRAWPVSSAATCWDRTSRCSAWPTRRPGGSGSTRSAGGPARAHLVVGAGPAGPRGRAGARPPRALGDGPGADE